MSLTPTADRVIAIAKSQIGYHEGRDPSGNWNNIQKYSPQVPGLEWSQGQAWCATFIAWLAMKAGVAYLFPRTASTIVAASWFQSRGQWSEFPAIGAMGFLSHGSVEFHTFLVIGYDATYVYTIEGNSNTNGSPQGDGVYNLKRIRRDAVVEGYGYPAYPEGIISADPAWADRAPHAPNVPNAKTASFRVATSNLMALPTNPHVKATLQATPAASVIGVQEADPNSYKQIIASLPGYAVGGDLHRGDDSYASFVLYKPLVWEHVRTQFIRQYVGVLHISKTRHIAVTVLRHRALNKQFAFMSYHAVTAGNDANRKRMRTEGLRALRKVLSAFRSAKTPVIVLGDFNQTGNILVTADLHTANRIDHQFAWNGAGVKMRRLESHLKNTASDHDALVVTYGVAVK